MPGLKRAQQAPTEAQIPQTDLTREEAVARPRAPWLRLVTEPAPKTEPNIQGTGSVDVPLPDDPPRALRSADSVRRALSAERSELLSARRRGQLTPEDACYLESLEIELDRLDEAELRAADERDRPLLDRLATMIAELRAFRDKVPRRA
jgi:hypothetical protein